MARPTPQRASAGAIGGASGDGGVEYRRAVAAYAVAHALAGQPLAGFGFPLHIAQVAAVALETDEHVDDVLVTFTGGQRAQVQAKRTLRFGPVLGKVAAQWVSAAVAGLDPGLDRLVAVTGEASGPVRELAAALERGRTDLPGGSTAGQAGALARLDKFMPGLSEEQRMLVRKCAVITVLDVEEEQAPGAHQAQILLAYVTGDGDAAVRVWRDLLAHCGRVARLRGGYKVEGWVRLVQQEGHPVSGADTPAAYAARAIAAVDVYRDMLRARGSTVDLRPLGADAAPIPLKDLDAEVRCVPAGADERDAEVLPWSLLRRRRILLTGLPGGGKSIAVAAVAAVLVDAAGAPLPLVASLRDVDRLDGSMGFADRLLEAAVKDIPAAERPLVRETLEAGLASGGVALLLDSLDETHDRRGAVVAEVAELSGRLSPDVPVLLATRDVAYAQAATLGWDDVRLAKPREPLRPVRAVLLAVATARGLAQPDQWIAVRSEWVSELLNRDPALGETPLLPVLLALLAADRSDGALPTTRATILHGIVEASVRRREARRDPGLRVATLNEHDSAHATLAAFDVEAAVLADAGGRAPLTAMRREVAVLLSTDWNLPPGAAAAGAEAIVHFWDETGVFVIRGAEEVIEPRTELFLDIGDAVHAAAQPPEVVAQWVDARIRDRRHEPLILAAALNETAASQFIGVACDTGEYELLLAAGVAVRQHARVTPDALARLASALTKEASRPDAEGWKAYKMLLELTPGAPLPADVHHLLAAYPSEHRVIGLAAAALHCRPADPPGARRLLDALHVHRLPRLPRRTPGASKPWSLLADDLYSEVVEAAARQLLGTDEETARLVVALLPEVGMGLHGRLLKMLEEAGQADAAREVLEGEARRFAAAFAPLAGFDREGPVRFLEYMIQGAPIDLTTAESGPLDEFADFFQTLDLNTMGNWPRRDEYEPWLGFVDAVRALGGFEPALLAAEANVALRRVERFGSDPFFALEIASERRKLDRWHEVDEANVAATVDALYSALYLGSRTAKIAAVALMKAPPDLAVPRLEAAVADLASSRRHQWAAAHALAELKEEEPLREWTASPHPALRLVAAERLRAAIDAGINPLLGELSLDSDLDVAAAAIRTIAQAGTSTARDALARVAVAPRHDWTCAHCRHTNLAADLHCSNCHVVPPDPAKIAAELVAGLGEADAEVGT